MRHLSVLMLVGLVASPDILASEGPPPPITPETLVGVWEAAPSWAQRVYRLEINATGPSYLAFNIFGQDLLWRLTSSEVHRGQLKLHFHCLTHRLARKDGGPEMDELEISAKGNASEVGGTFEGTLKMKYTPWEAPEDMTVSFTKPPWVQSAAKQAQDCEAMIKGAKLHPK